MSAVKYRMIAIDLDGTLLSPLGKVTERTKAAIHDCLSAGMLICFATGRNWTESRSIVDTVAHHDHAVFAGGAIVIDTREEVVLHRQMVDPQLAREICKVLEDAGHAVLALQETSPLVLIISSATTCRSMRDDALDERHQCISASCNRLSQYSHEHTLRLGIVAEREKVANWCMMQLAAKIWRSNLLPQHVCAARLGRSARDIRPGGEQVARHLEGG